MAVARLSHSAHPEPVEGSVAITEKTLRQAPIDAACGVAQDGQGEREGRGSPLRFAGYAAIFDRPDRGGDIIRKGAFARTLAERRHIPLLWQHERGHVIGRIETLEEDRRGLRVIARLEEGAVPVRLAKGSGLSFGYRVRSGRSAGVRELLDLDLVEISVVAIPMQPMARVHAMAD